MNRKLITSIALAIAVMTVGTVSVFAQKLDETKIIGKESAIDIAIENAKVQKEDVKLEDVELDRDGLVKEYEVEFKVGNTEYDYNINAETGEIINSDINVNDKDDDKDELNDVDDKDDDKDDLDDADDKDDDKDDLNDVNDKDDDKDDLNDVNDKDDDNDDLDDINDEEIVNQNYIGAAKAKEIALKAANIVVENTTELECELDNDNGVATYEVQWNSGDNEYEYEINAVDGSIMHSEVENDRNDD